VKVNARGLLERVTGTRVAIAATSPGVERYVLGVAANACERGAEAASAIVSETLPRIRVS
jgi:hypothetical protein